MDTGNFDPYSFEEYKEFVLALGVSREWEIELSYNMYLAYFYGSENEIKHSYLNTYYNSILFMVGSLN
jgi:hypothetical protein